MRTLTFAVLMLLFHFGNATEVRALPIDNLPAPTLRGMDSRFVSDAGYGLRAGIKNARALAGDGKAAEKENTISDEVQCMNGANGRHGCYLRMLDKKTGIACYASVHTNGGWVGVGEHMSCAPIKH